MNPSASTEYLLEERPAYVAGRGTQEEALACSLR